MQEVDVYGYKKLLKYVSRYFYRGECPPKDFADEEAQGEAKKQRKGPHQV
jgi:hypothetical protein